MIVNLLLAVALTAFLVLLMHGMASRAAAGLVKRRPLPVVSPVERRLAYLRDEYARDVLPLERFEAEVGDLLLAETAQTAAERTILPPR